jgi:arylsulfatase
MERTQSIAFAIAKSLCLTSMVTACGGGGAPQAGERAEGAAPPPIDAGIGAPDADAKADAKAGVDDNVDADGDANVDADAQAALRPNILLIVADDLGYSDIGAFGGEIHTPNLDALAGEGRVLTSHHAAATCSPTRAMLFSGTDHHLVGLGTMAEEIDDGQRGKPGYEGYLNDSSLSIAELLRDSGYHTYMAGKWHLGLDDAHTPKSRGFESSFALLQGAASHFAPVPGRPVPADRVQYREDGVYTTIPPSFFSSNFYADKLIGYIQKNIDDRVPFFAYAAFTAPHWPLQAPPDYIDRYKGKYDEGYEVIRQRRLEKQKALGIVPTDFEVNPGLPDSLNTPKWDSLTGDQKAVEARTMEVYAAMVENLDANIGRIIQSLKDAGRYDDTFVFFESDNGAEGEPSRIPVDASTNNTLENIGHSLSNVAYGRRWAEVSATPFGLWKAFSSEGGVSVPAIARFPHQAVAHAAFTQFTHVTDLAPTFLALAGAASPGSSYNGHDVHPMTGVSLVPGLSGTPGLVRPTGAVIADELFGRRYVHKNDWKASWIEPPWGAGAWALYDLGTDRGEVHDLAGANPEVVTDLSASFDDYATRVGVVMPQRIGTGSVKGP